MWYVADSLTFSGSEDEDDEESNSSASGLMKHHLHSQLHPGTPETNNNSLSAGDLQGPLSHSVVDTKGQDDSEDQGRYTWRDVRAATDLCNAWKNAYLEPQKLGGVKKWHLNRNSHLQLFRIPNRPIQFFRKLNWNSKLSSVPVIGFFFF